MNRKDPKPKRLSNKGLIESALEDLQKETEFHFTDIKFGNGYFLFSFEKNSICHFHIKEIPGYLFAIWNAKNVNLDYYGHEAKGAELILFAQHELTLDKFKPSNSALRTFLHRSAYIEDDEIIEDWDNIPAYYLLKFIKTHKLTSFYLSSWSSCDIINYRSSFYLLWNYIHTHWYYFKKALSYKIKKLIILNYIKRNFKHLRNIKYFIIDRGKCWSPRLDLFLYENTHLSKLNKKEEDKLQKVYDKLVDKYIMDISVIYFDSKSKFYYSYNNVMKHKDIEEELLWKKI